MPLSARVPLIQQFVFTLPVLALCFTWGILVASLQAELQQPVGVLDGMYIFTVPSPGRVSLESKSLRPPAAGTRIAALAEGHVGRTARRASLRRQRVKRRKITPLPTLHHTHLPRTRFTHRPPSPPHRPPPTPITPPSAPHPTPSPTYTQTHVDM